ncbi:MAG: GAF domain-containing protein [Sphingobium sp.]|nr:GAF domain-containing protein [Sphingobium sp.]
MAKHPFIRATEIWVPTQDRRHLDLEAGLYGDMRFFQSISRGMRFEHGAGLPGKTWATGRPMVLKDLKSSYFRRGDAAMDEGLSCAVSLPIFVAGDLTAVMVFLCGDDKYHAGAVELWSPEHPGAPLSLVAGYFGSARQFEATARSSSFPRGVGLPGKAWESGMPIIMENIGPDSFFLRHETAGEVGINRAVGLPCSVGDGSDYVLTFLSALNTPIARRFECWLPDEAGESFTFHSGYCETAGSLAAFYADTRLPLYTGAFGTARARGVPVIAADLSRESGAVADSANLAGLTSMVATPVYSGGAFQAILAWFL